EVEHFADIAPAVVNFQRLSVVTFAPAYVTVHVHVREEVHFHLHHAVTLAGLAAPTLHIEGKTPGVIPAGASLGHPREKLAYGGEHACVSGRVAARCTADGALVHRDDFVEMGQAF